MNPSFRVLLCIPPDYDWNYPPLGTAALLGHLKLKKKIRAEQEDYNMQYRNFLFEKSRMTGNVSAFLKRQILRSLFKKYFTEEKETKYYYKFLPRKDNFPLLNLPYDNNTNSSFFFTERLLSSDILYRYIIDEKENTFLIFFREKDIVSKIKRKNLGLLGISITSPSQVIPSLTLAYLVKRSSPGIHITVGGQWASLYRDEIMSHAFFQDFFDTVIYFEGETPLGCLVDSLMGKKNLEEVPNLIYSKDKIFCKTPLQSEENLDTLPCPDFEGLPLYEYTFNERGEGLTLTFETSRGCYWGRCAFCVDLPLPKLRYRRKNPALVARDIKELIRKYRANGLLFSDPALSPIQMKEVAELILKENVKISWQTMARLDNGFNQEIFEAARKAGLSSISFGFESASDRVCEKLAKGNKKNVSLRVIDDCSRAGVLANLQVMLGLPTERFEDGLDTVEFLARNKEKINNVCFNEYYLTTGNCVYENPEKYEIEFRKDASLPFKVFNEFTRVGGLTSAQSDLLKGMHHYLCNKTAYNKKKLDLSSLISLNGMLALSEAAFKLNDREVKISYLSSSTSLNDFVVLNEIEQDILSLLNKGAQIAVDIIKMIGRNNLEGAGRTERDVLSSIEELYRHGIIKMNDYKREKAVPWDALLYQR